MRLETHGCWPLIGAGAIVPVSGLAARAPQLQPLAALLWHQTEEWVWPGSFLPWINREVIGSDEDEFPLDRRTAFVINVVFGWGLSAATVAGARAAAPAALLYVSRRALRGGIAVGLATSACLMPAMRLRARRGRRGREA